MLVISPHNLIPLLSVYATIRCYKLGLCCYIVTPPPPLPVLSGPAHPVPQLLGRDKYLCDAFVYRSTFVYMVFYAYQNMHMSVIVALVLYPIGSSCLGVVLIVCDQLCIEQLIA